MTGNVDRTVSFRLGPPHVPDPFKVNISDMTSPMIDYFAGIFEGKNSRSIVFFFYRISVIYSVSFLSRCSVCKINENLRSSDDFNFRFIKNLDITLKIHSSSRRIFLTMAPCS